MTQLFNSRVLHVYDLIFMFISIFFSCASVEKDPNEVQSNETIQYIPGLLPYRKTTVSQKIGFKTHLCFIRSLANKKKLNSSREGVLIPINESPYENSTFLFDRSCDLLSETRVAFVCFLISNETSKHVQLMLLLTSLERFCILLGIIW